ncbi:MAG TPA: WD40 repeat domain-containing protein [Solirubrobacteraceae bacterium]|nr:WD40 repeat domain-containing protein [Solirubrobacteraceae bacterium]
MRVLITSSSGANGQGYGALLSFSAQGALRGTLSHDSRLVDPRGMAPHEGDSLIYVNSGDDRVLALDQGGDVVLDSGRIPGLDPGGGKFGPDGRYYVTVRTLGTIRALPAELDDHGELVIPECSVPFPRGFEFGGDGRLYLASGIGPTGQGDNTIVVFDHQSSEEPTPLVSDPELSPLDMTMSPRNTLLVSSEWPFGEPDASTSVREYDTLTGELVRVLTPDPSVGLRRPRGLRLTPDGLLYWVGEEHLVAFEYSSGQFLGTIVRLERLNGQAVVIVS